MSDYPCYEIFIGGPGYRESIKLREAVLREPQGMTFGPGELQSEVGSKHMVCMDGDVVIGCAVLLPLNGKEVRLRQMAVDERYRGRGVGRNLLDFAERLASEDGFADIIMHARLRSEGFYKRFGYQAEGVQFEEVGVPHLLMRKRLARP